MPKMPPLRLPVRALGLAVLAGGAIGVLQGVGAAQGGEAPAGRGFAVIVGVDDFSRAQGGWQNLTACVNDAVDLAKMLSQQAFYQGPPGQPRIHLFTQAAPGAANAAPEEIPYVKRTYGFRDGKFSVLDVLAELNRGVGESDLVLVVLSTHGQYLDAAGFRELRLLLPEYDPARQTSYLTFGEIVNELRTAPARLAFMLNSCHAEGTIGVASTDYYDQISRENRCRFVISSCKQNQSSYIRTGDRNSLFGQALIEALQGAAVSGVSGEVTVESAFEYLQKQVKDRAAALGHAQEPLKRDYTGGLDSRTVLSRPSGAGPLVVDTNAEGLPALVQTLGGGTVLAGLARTEALTVLSLHLRDLTPAAAGQKGPTQEEIDEARSRLADTEYQPPADLEAWEMDRLGLGGQPATAPERKAKREAWVNVLGRFLPTQAAGRSTSYGALLAAAGIPPCVARARAGPEWRDLSYGPGEPVRLDVPFQGAEGALDLAVAGEDPELLVQVDSQTPKGLGTHRVKVALWVPVEPGDAASGGRWVREGEVGGSYRLAKTQPPPVPLAAKDTTVSVRLKEKGRDSLVSSPRRVVLRCPEGLTVDQPEPGASVYQPAQELQGRVWTASGTAPVVSVQGSDRAEARIEAPDAQGVSTWRAALTLKEGANDLTVSARRPDGSALGEVRLSLSLSPVPIVGTPPAGMEFRLAPGATPTPGERVSVRLCRGDVPVLEGDFLAEQGRVRASLDTMTPIRRPVLLEVEGGALDLDLLEISPLDVPLTKLAGHTESDAVDRRSEPWQLAGGTYEVRVVGEWGRVWQVSVQGGAEPTRFTVRTDDAEPRVTLNALRHNDAALDLSATLADRAVTTRLRRKWDDSAAPITVPADGKAGPLEAGDYYLDIEYGQGAEFELDTEKLPEGASVAQAQDDRITLALVIPSAGGRGPLGLALSFRDRYASRQLPFAPGLESVAIVDGRQFGPVPAGERNVKLPREITGGEVVVRTREGNVEYWRGTLRDDRIEPREGGAIRGSLQLGTAAEELADLALAPVADRVGFPDPEYRSQPADPRQPQWNGVPVGDYKLTATLALPGLAPLPLEEAVTIGPGRNTADARQLLAGLDKLKLQLQLRPVFLGMGALVPAEGGTEGVPEARLTVERLAAAEAASFLGKNGLSEAGSLLAMAANAALLSSGAQGRAVKDGAVVYEEGLPEGIYRVEVKLPGREDWIAASPGRIDVGPGRERFELRLQSWLRDFPFTVKEPAGAADWTAWVEGLQRDSTLEGGNLRLALFEETEDGQVEVRKGDLVIWRGTLSKGKLSPAGGGDGFSRGSLRLAGAVAGMSGELTGRETGVPYAATAPGYQPKNPGPAKERAGLAWDDLPVGDYWLSVRAFKRLPVSVREGPPTGFAAAELTPELVQLTITLPEGIPEAAVESCLLTPADVPALGVRPEAFPELRKGLDLKRAGWQQTLPLGTYHIKATWKEGGQARTYEGTLSLE